LRCGFDAVFFVVASLPTFLPSMGISISCCPLEALQDFFAVFSCADAPALRLHQIDNVAGDRAIPLRDRLAGALLVDEVDQRCFVLVLELFRLKLSGLLVDDVLGEIEHVPRFHILDLVEVLFFISDFVGVSKKPPH
jgi:hypothetical protein